MKQSVIEIFRYDVTTIWLPVLLLLTQSPSRRLVLVSQTETQFEICRTRIAANLTFERLLSFMN